MSILIVANARSFNKGISHIDALRELGQVVYLLVNSDPSDREKNILNKFDNLLVSDFTDFEKIKPIISNKEITFVIILSENLLVLQNKIEAYLKLPESMPLASAEILSNKWLFDCFCKNNNIAVPRHKLLRHTDDFDIDYPCITKATIGSGHHYTIRDKDVFFEYKRFTNGQTFKEYLIQHGLLENFLSSNANGMFLDRYGKVPLNFYTQEYIYADRTYCAAGAIVNGAPYFYLTGQLIKYSEYDSLLDVDNIDSEGKPNHSTEHLMYIMNPPEDELVKKFKQFYCILIDKLKIRNMFFSGPDIYANDTGEFIVDLNCRISGQFNLIYKTIAPQSVVNTWRSLLFNQPMVDYQLTKSAATGYPIILAGTYVKQTDLVNKDVEFINFEDTLVVPATRRNMENKNLLEKIVVYGNDSDEVKKNYLAATTTILSSYKQNTLR